MAFKYKARIKRTWINDKENYYPVPSNTALITTRMIADEIAHRSSLTSGDVFSVLIELSVSMQTHLINGRSVKLEDIGLFSLSLTSDPAPSPKDLKPSKVRVSKICFKPSKELKKKFKDIEFKRG